MLSRYQAPEPFSLRISARAFRFISFLFVLWLAVFLVMTCVSSRAIAGSLKKDPNRKNTSAELVMDDDFHPAPGTCYYDVFLQGVRLGKATITVLKKGDDFSVEVAAKTSSTLSNLYKVRYRGMALITADPIAPISAIVEEQAGSRHKTISMEFPEPNRVTAVQVEKKKGKLSKHTQREFLSESFVLDPFSTVFLIRNLKWELGTKEIFDVFTGRKQYQLELLCSSETVLEVDGKPRDAWLIQPRVRSLKEPRKVKMSSYVIYLSKDSKKEILKITGEPKAGSVIAKMRKFEKDE